MKILFLGINYWPEKTGIAPVMTQRCEYLASRGHDVQVCTGLPYYPEWKVDPKSPHKAWSRESVRGVTVLRSWLWVPARVTSIKRILHEASFIASSFVRALFTRKPDLLVIESPPLGLAIVAVVLSKMWGIPYVFDVMDLQPDAAAELGMLRAGKLLNWLYRTERLAYEKARLVMTLTFEMAQRIVAKGIAKQKVAVSPIPATESAFKVLEESGEPFRQAHGFQNEFLVVHSGNMGVKQGLDVVLHAAKATEGEQITYLLIGSGADRPRLEELMRSMSLKNVRFLPVLPDEAFAQALAAADVVLVTQQKSVSDIVFPSKTVTYLAAGKPVLASVNRESRVAQTIVDAQAGRVVEAENGLPLAAEIRAASADQGMLQRWARNGHEYAYSKWHPEAVLREYEKELLAAADRSAESLVTLAPEPGKQSENLASR